MSNIKNQSIFKKKKKEAKFSIIANDVLEDQNLSYKAMGILNYILSKPDDWIVYISDLVRPKDAETSIRSGIKELIENRYMQRYRVYDAETKKVNHWETLVSEEPFQEEELISRVVEKYYRNSDGTILLQTIKCGKSTRQVQLVEIREVELLSQKRKVGGDDIKELLSQNLKIGKLKIENNRQLILNKTKTNSNQNLITSSDNLVKIFEEGICELRKTTKAKFQKLTKTYDPGMIFQVIQECMRSSTYSYKKFEMAFIDYLERGCKTREDVSASAAAYRKNIKITEKEEKKANLHNFTARDYNYDNLEKMLLGDMEYNIDELYNK